jgi:hypothetical protein
MKYSGARCRWLVPINTKVKCLSTVQFDVCWYVSHRNIFVDVRARRCYNSLLDMSSVTLTLLYFETPIDSFHLYKKVPSFGILPRVY